MSNIEVERLNQLEAVIRQNPKIRAGIDRYGDVRISQLIYRSAEEQAKGLLEKRQVVEIGFDFEPPLFNSLILSLAVSHSVGSTIGDVANTSIRYQYLN